MPLNAFRALLEGDENASDQGQGNSQLPVVLLVDDDAEVLSALRFLLSSVTEYRVQSFLSAQDAVDAVTEETAAVVLDVKMQGHDGFWTCDAMRRKNPHLPVIFYSGYQDAKDPFEIINQHRPFGYVVKGGDTSILLETIERAVKYSSAIIDIKRLVQKLEKGGESAAGEPGARQDGGA